MIVLVSDSEDTEDPVCKILYSKYNSVTNVRWISKSFRATQKKATCHEIENLFKYSPF